MVCDLIRTCYSRPCKFFNNSDVEIPIRWYRAPAGAKVFPGPQKFNSLHWYAFPWHAEGTGEVYGGSVTYDNGSTPAGVTGQGFFGPAEYFRNGAPFNPGNVTPRLPSGPAVECVTCPGEFIADESGGCSILLEEDGGGIKLET